MQDTSMKKSFETTLMKILVEEISHTGSAFATTEEGEGVFLNGRMVDRLALEGEEILMAKQYISYKQIKGELIWLERKWKKARNNSFRMLA